MATRFYLPSDAEKTPISPTPDAAWEDTSILVRAMCKTSKRSSAMTTIPFADADTTNMDILFRQYVSEELEPGQGISEQQTACLQCRVAQQTNSMCLAFGVRVIAGNGTTVRKILVPVTRGDLEAPTVLTNRGVVKITPISDYITIGGDRLVIELGMGGDPTYLGDGHTCSMRLGDAAGSDLIVGGNEQTDNNPWMELEDDLTFVPPRGSPPSGEVFTDSFTVAADVNIDAYPATPDYAYNQGSGTNMRVVAATDKATVNVTNTSVHARIINAAVPSGDQEITADCYAADSYSSGAVTVRMATSGNLENFYMLKVELVNVAEVRLYRCDNGTFTLLASADRGFSGPQTVILRLKATGSGATVSLEAQVNATAVLTYDDTSASRKTSGPPGIGGWTSTTAVTVDNVSVNDLAAGGGPIIPAFMHTYKQRRVA